jgi:kynurenine formamidase
MKTRFWQAAGWLAVPLVVGCSPATVPLPQRIVDLSPTITEDLPVRVWGQKLLRDFGFRETTRFEHIEIEQPVYVQNSYLELFNHGGAHLDAPRHLARDGKGVDEYELTQLLGRARVLDFRQAPKDQPLGRAEFENRGIQAGDIVLVLVGYSPPTASDQLASYAYLSREAAEYLAQIPVKAIGTDAWSLENPKRLYELMAAKASGYETVAPAHYAFLPRGIPVFEELENLDQLVAEENIVFVGFPLKIRNGDASPVRAAALMY